MAKYHSYFLTRYGAGIVSASDLGVTGVELPDVSRSDTDSHHEQSKFEPSEISIHSALMLQRYFLGECIDFCDIPVDLRALPPFRQKVLNKIRTVAFGEICSYGHIAELCGSPHAARAVGGALAANPIPIIIPCHRVVASDGRLTGFSAPGGVNAKKIMLQLEGIEFKGLLVVTNQLVMHRIAC
ncbi:MAG: methylated-DNA--[protein]-cysteine S-methyltransferase [Desulfuromonadaceae bacterium]|nr:methylated-DNA--[protein]-cysteine S-methyltransferase [Desulfuromonadaceae bacterium]